MATISTTLTPLVSDMGLIPFMILSIILVGCLTQIMHNIVLGAMFIPVLCPLCEQLGGNAFVLWYMLYVTLNCAFVTPAASMQSAMVHDMSGNQKICVHFWHYGISFKLDNFNLINSCRGKFV